jgi:hypothetical protein
MNERILKSVVFAVSTVCMAVTAGGCGGAVDASNMGDGADEGAAFFATTLGIHPDDRRNDFQSLHSRLVVD